MALFRERIGLFRQRLQLNSLLRFQLGDPLTGVGDGFELFTGICAMRDHGFDSTAIFTLEVVDQIEAFFTGRPQ